MFYEPLEGKKVRCFLCAHHCNIKEGKRGICHVREHRGGVLNTLVYGKVISMNVDPIEKKPLFHFLPGSTSLSIATVGCNFRCEHCQNYSISEYPRVHDAVRYGCESISYTYTEPTIFFEFAFDCAKLARAKGIRNVFVSNGYISPEAARAIAPYLDVNNIDLKGDDEFYRNLCGARLKPVQETIRLMKELGVWVEVTTLIIPGYNDTDQQLQDIAGFLVSVDRSIPWHVSQFYPTHRLTDTPRTPLSTLRKACDIGYRAGLAYVYEGNVPGNGGEDTHCPECRELLISRVGFSIKESRLKEDACPICGFRIHGVWK